MGRQPRRHRVPGAPALPAGPDAVPRRYVVHADAVVRRDGGLRLCRTASRRRTTTCASTASARSGRASRSSPRPASRRRHPTRLTATAATFTPDPSKVLFMNAGDRISVSIHDSSAGLVTAINDQTTGERGSMTASIANGFAHPLFQPDASTGSEAPYAFHPMYSTSNEHTRCAGGRALVQRRVLGRDRPLRVLQPGEPARPVREPGRQRLEASTNQADRARRDDGVLAAARAAERPEV
jgi:hypothetical protein